MSFLLKFISSSIIIYLTPLIPLSFKGEGEVWVERGFAPLGLPIFSLLLNHLLYSGEF